MLNNILRGSVSFPITISLHLFSPWDSTLKKRERTRDKSWEWLWLIVSLLSQFIFNLLHTAGIKKILMWNWWLLRMHHGIWNSWNTNNIKSTFRVGFVLKMWFLTVPCYMVTCTFYFPFCFPWIGAKKYILLQIKACLKYLILNINSENQSDLKTENYSELSLNFCFERSFLISLILTVVTIFLSLPWLLHQSQCLKSLESF